MPDMKPTSPTDDTKARLSRTVAVPVKNSTRYALEQMAAKQGSKLTAFVRKILEEYVNNNYRSES